VIRRDFCARLGLTFAASEIYETLLDRLEQIWAYYLSFQARAAKELKAPLSSAPCSPAPGRRIIILRSDNHLSSANLFVSFDRVIPPSSSLHASGYRNHGMLRLDADGFPPEPQSSQKRKWNILKSMFSSPANPKPGEVTPPGSSDESEMSSVDTSSASLCSQESSSQGTEDSESLRRPSTSHQPFCFRFSLEWLDRPQWPSKNKRLFTPCLPVATHLHVQHRRSMALARSNAEDPIDLGAESGGDDSTTGTQDSYITTKTSVDAPSDVSVPNQLRNERLVASKYAGRALAEWGQVVSECDSFFERRRDEGVPSDRLVETPTLGVDSFRK
jgi:hypothetical protein